MTADGVRADAYQQGCANLLHQRPASVLEESKDVETVPQEAARCYEGCHLRDLMADEVGRLKITNTPLWIAIRISEMASGKGTRTLAWAGLVGEAPRSRSPGRECCKQRRKHPVASKSGCLMGELKEGNWALSPIKYRAV